VVGRRAIALGLLVMAAVAIGGVFLARSAREISTDLENLAAVEIKEYEGTDLSSIADFRENSIKGPQRIDLVSYRLKVDGLVENPLEYTLEEATGDHQSYQKVVTLSCVEGWRVRILWEGVLVKDLIAEAKALPEANTVIFHAHDGYTTSLPLDYITGQDIMLAYKMNGLVLPPERGAPFQLVAESKWGYKWIKWVTEIELSDDINYKGYWEKRGYSNDGNL
jgi:DMSO/TMAO reductase YedYZ molybdopterin-dependent catalytic subunit